MPNLAVRENLPRKRIFICIDGTGQDASTKDKQESNVAKFRTCIANRADDRVSQIVLYEYGCKSKLRGAGKSE